jgi:hypothetical protein
VTWGWNEVVGYLVEKGARIDLADASGRTAYDTATGGGQRGRGDTDAGKSETAALLLELCAAQAGCDADALTARDEADTRGGPRLQ